MQECHHSSKLRRSQVFKMVRHGASLPDSGGMVWYLISFINIDSRRHIGVGYTRCIPCSAMEASLTAKDSTLVVWETGPRWKRCSSNFDCQKKKFL